MSENSKIETQRVKATEQNQASSNTIGNPVSRDAYLLSNVGTFTDPRLEARRGEILAQFEATLTNPDVMVQSQASCVARTTAIALARNNPDRYARIVNDLLTKGYFETVVGGKQVRINLTEDIVSEAIRSTGSRQSLLDALVQKSFMRFAASQNGKDIVFAGAEFTTSTIVGADGKTYERNRQGLYPFEQDLLMEAVTGKKQRVVSKLDDMTPQQLLNEVEEQIKRNGGAQVCVTWNDATSTNHCIYITKIENGRVYFSNGLANDVDPRTLFSGGPSSWDYNANANPGERESMALTEFKQRVFMVVVGDQQARWGANPSDDKSMTLDTGTRINPYVGAIGFELIKIALSKSSYYRDNGMENRVSKEQEEKEEI